MGLPSQFSLGDRVADTLIEVLSRKLEEEAEVQVAEGDAAQEDTLRRLLKLQAKLSTITNSEHAELLLGWVQFHLAEESRAQITGVQMTSSVTDRHIERTAQIVSPIVDAVRLCLKAHPIAAGDVSVFESLFQEILDAHTQMMRANSTPSARLQASVELISPVWRLVRYSRSEGYLDSATAGQFHQTLSEFVGRDLR